MDFNIEDILDDCIAEIRAGKTIEDTLNQYPQLADELRPLLNIAGKLNKLPAPSVSANGLMHTMAVLSTQNANLKKRLQQRRITVFSKPVLIRIAAAIMIVFIVGWTAVTSSAQALPGDILYPVKLLTERVRFFLTVNHEDKAELRLTFSDERLKELVKKYGKNGAIDKNLLIAMLNEAKLAVQTSPKLPEISRKLLICRAAYLSEFQEKTLQELKDQVKPTERKKLIPFMDACRQRCSRMQRMMNTAPGPSSIPSKQSRQQDRQQQGTQKQNIQQQDTQSGMKMCPMWQKKGQCQ